jgi:hypothetical protein
MRDRARSLLLRALAAALPMELEASALVQTPQPRAPAEAAQRVAIHRSPGLEPDAEAATEHWQGRNY